MPRLITSSQAIAVAGAGSAILAGFANVVNQSTDTIIMNHSSVAAYWLTALSPIVFTFLAVVSSTLLSTAIATVPSLRPRVPYIAVACVLLGIGLDMGAWYASGLVWLASWLDMVGRVAILIGVELAIILAILTVLDKHPLIDESESIQDSYARKQAGTSSVSQTLSDV